MEYVLLKILLKCKISWVGRIYLVDNWDVSSEIEMSKVSFEGNFFLERVICVFSDVFCLRV